LTPEPDQEPDSKILEQERSRSLKKVTPAASEKKGIRETPLWNCKNWKTGSIHFLTDGVGSIEVITNLLYFVGVMAQKTQTVKVLFDICHFRRWSKTGCSAANDDHNSQFAMTRFTGCRTWD